MSFKKTGKHKKKGKPAAIKAGSGKFVWNPRNIMIMAAALAAVAAAVHFGVNAIADNFISGKWAVGPLFKITSGKDGIPHIHIKDALKLYDRKNTVFIDARGEGEYEEAHIKGAISIPAGASPDKITGLKDVLKGKTLVTYCHGVGCHLSDKTAYALYDAGYRNIRIFFGGWNEWTQANYPVDKYEPPEQYKRLFTDGASPENAQEVTAGDVQFLINKNLGTVVDVDTGAKYLSLHIDRAMSMPIEKMDAGMAPFIELFKQKPVVIYCHGSDKKLKAAAAKLFKAGARKILLFPGALDKWEKAGFTLDRPRPRQ